MTGPGDAAAAGGHRRPRPRFARRPPDEPSLPSGVQAVRRAVGGLLTRRGWWLALVCAVFVLAGGLAGIHELYGLAGGGLTLLAVAVVWARVWPWDVEAERHVQPTRVAAGERPTVQLTLRNRAGRLSPTLALQDPFGGRTGPELLVAPIPAGASTAHHYRLPPAERGLVTVGPLTAAMTDPFGLASRQRRLAATERVIVHPAPAALPARVLAGGGARGGGRRAAGLVFDTSELANLREYRPGDDPRWVHWASSARRDTLIVREAERTQRSRVVVVVDLRAPMWTAAGLEVALGAAARTVDEALREGLEVGLLTTAGADSGLGSGPAQRGRILDQLTVAGVHRGTGFALGTSRTDAAPLTAGLALDDRAVVVTSERVTPADLRRMRELAEPAPLTVVVVDTRAPSPGRSPGRDPAGTPGDGGRDGRPAAWRAAAERAADRVLVVPAGDGREPREDDAP